MSLASQVRIARRFLRATRIDSDMGDPKALEGFICTASFKEALSTMMGHIRETGQGAFTWTGPYGGGKSSLALALSALLRNSAASQKSARKIFGEALAGEAAQALPAGKNGWRIVPVVGRRGDPVKVIGEALQSHGVVQRAPHGGWSEGKLLSKIQEVSEPGAAKHSGLLILIDEMGKFLESAAREGTDVHVFQQMAEIASRSGRRLLVIGMLHQSFSEYADRLSREMRDEWAKVQGRFLDLAISVSNAEQAELISRAIEGAPQTKQTHGTMQDSSRRVANEVARSRSTDTDALAKTLESCWPLHPVVTSLLGPISRRRFGQNQRSIFGFLNSAEPHGFQDFLQSAEDGDIYTPDQLWDYLRANLEPSIMASPDGHRWATASEAIERCEGNGGDAQDLRLLKTIAVVGLFKEGAHLQATRDLLQACFPDTSLTQALKGLEDESVVVFRKFQDAYAIFAGSDFDIDKAIHEVVGSTEIDFEMLQELANLRPVLAKRHYQETGAQRWFEVSLIPAQQLAEPESLKKPPEGAMGRFLLAIPTEGEDEGTSGKLCKRAAKAVEGWCLAAGPPKHAAPILALARELVALQSVRDDRPELLGDPVARREIEALLGTLREQLEAELQKAFQTTWWSYRGGFSNDLNEIASKLADRKYPESPILHNELINRDRPSTSANAARNILLQRMITHEGEENLGMEGWPAERGLLASVLVDARLYRKEGRRWTFGAPKSKAHRLSPLWKKAAQHIRDNPGRQIPVEDIYDLWAGEPYGVKKGLLPILAMAFVLANRSQIAIYQDGAFLAQFSNLDPKNLTGNPDSIQLRWMELPESSMQLLEKLAEVVQGLAPDYKLDSIEPIEVARGLVAIHDALPEWTRYTAKLSAEAIQIRELFKRARDPNRVLFDDLPALLGEGTLDTAKAVQGTVASVEKGLRTLMDAYPSMLHSLRDLMLNELEVPNMSPQSLQELRKRAEAVRGMTGDFRLEAFVNRLLEFDGANADSEGIASLAANKPPKSWRDPDYNKAALELTEMAQGFCRAEVFTRIKGVDQRRHSIAIMTKTKDYSSALQRTFSVTRADQAKAKRLAEKLEATLSGTNDKIALAAIAELGAKLVSEQSDDTQPTHKAAAP